MERRVTGSEYWRMESLNGEKKLCERRNQAYDEQVKQSDAIRKSVTLICSLRPTILLYLSHCLEKV